MGRTHAKTGASTGATASASWARANFAELIGRVAYAKERITLARRGRPLAVLVPVEDLERLEDGRETAAGANEDLLRAIGENIPGTVYRRTLHADGRTSYPYISAGVRDLLGHEPDRVMKRAELLTANIHPDDRGLRQRAIAESARTLRPYDVTYRCFTAAGDTKWIRARARPRRQDNGDITWNGITLDITEHKRAEAALQKVNERLQAILDNTPAIVWIKDRDHRYELVNREFAEQFGLPRQEIEGRSDRDIFGNEMADLYRANDRRVFETGDAQIAEEPALQRDGLHTRLSVQFPLEFGDARPISICGISTDITERKRAEEALEKARDELELRVAERTAELRESNESLRHEIRERQRGAEALQRREAQFRQAQQVARFGYWAWSPEDDRLTVSPELAELLRVPLGAVMNLSNRTYTERFVHPDDRERYRTCTDIPPTPGARFDVEYRLNTEDDATRWVREIGEVILDEKDRLLGETGIVQDITERRRAEQTVRTREAWLTAVLDGSPIEIVLKDSDGKIFLANKKCLDGFAVTLDQMRGKRSSDFLPDDIASIYENADRRVLESGNPIQQEVTERLDGETRHYLNSKFPLRDETGSILGICSITTDISDLKVMQDQLRQAQKMEAVGQLTGGLAHDFNNLLAVILGNAESLGERLGADKAELEAVMRAATRGAELTGRLLAFSRRQPLRPQALDLADHVAGMSELLVRALGETIEVEVSSEAGLWRALADPGQLESALLNLALNAKDAMPEGGRLSIASANATLDAAGVAGEAEVEPGEYVVLSVSDAGTGMTPEVLARAFEPFFTTKDAGEGSGLGLSMVYGFARQSGGFATIDSEQGRGSTVKLHLPRAPAAAAAAKAEAGDTITRRGHGETVLVLEDAPDVRGLVVAMLEDLGYRAVSAGEAKAAAELLEQHADIDLLLTDVVLPGGKSGADFAEQAKRRRPPGLKVLFMSGYPAATLARRGKLGDDVALLSKPFRKAELARMVREIIEDD